MVLEGHIAYNPARRLPKVKQPRRSARPVQLAQIDAMYQQPLWQCTLDLIILLANTGLRMGEVVRIDGRDYDRRTRILTSVRKGVVVQQIPFNDAAHEVALRMPEQGWWFPAPSRNAQFPDGNGHILMKSASTKISRLLRRIGISDPRITGHSIRHFYACTLLWQGVPIRVVQELLGHASLATTQLYTQVTDEQKAEGVAKLPYIGPRHGKHLSAGRMVA